MEKLTKPFSTVPTSSLLSMARLSIAPLLLCIIFGLLSLILRISASSSSMARSASSMLFSSALILVSVLSTGEDVC